MAKIRTERHVVREKARKRTKNLFKKANELAQIADANIYVVIDRSGKFQVYKSTDTPGWPPSEQEIDNHYPIPKYKGPADFQPVKDGAGRQKIEGTQSKGSGLPVGELGGSSVAYRPLVVPIPKAPPFPRR